MSFLNIQVEELKYRIMKYLRDIDYTHDNRDNPIYNALEYEKLLKKPENPKEKDIIDLLLEIKDKMEIAWNCIAIKKSNDYKINTFPMNTYSTNSDMLEFDDLSNINIEELNRIINSKGGYISNGRVRVHEIAKNLNTKSQTIIQVAHFLKLENIKTAQSGVSEDEEKVITKFIKNIISYTHNLDDLDKNWLNI